MPRRKTSSRRAGPKVWIAALALVAALYAFGDDNPQARRILIEFAQDLLAGNPVVDMLGGGARVIDGDTIDLDGKRIRLHGIDAPESKQTCLRGRKVWSCGLEAARALERLIGVSEVQCEKKGSDRYGRIVATCRAGRQDVNAWMVRNGWALAYRQYGGAAYAADEAMARAKRAGVWSGRFVMPWDWRKDRTRKPTWNSAS